MALAGGAVSCVASEGDLPATAIRLSEVQVVDQALKQALPIQMVKLDRIQQRFALRVAEDEFQPNFNLSIGSSLAGSKDRSASPNQSTALLASSLTPSVDLRLPSGGSMSVTYVTLRDFTDLSPDPTAAYPLTQWGANWNISLSQPLLRGAGWTAATANLRMARLGNQQNIEQLRDTVMGVVSQALGLYRAFGAASRALEIARTSFQRGEELLDQNRLLALQGQLSDLEIKQAEANRATRQLSLLSSENAHDAARLALVRFLQLEDQIQIEPAEEPAVEKVTISRDEAMQMAFQTRPDVKVMRLNTQAIQISADVADNSLLYDLNLVTSLAGPGTSSANSFFKANEVLGRADKLNWSVGVVMNIPLWGDYSRRQAALGARIAVEKQEQAERQLMLNVQTDVLNSLRNLRITEQQLEIASANAGLARQAYEGQAEKLKSGLSSTFQLRQQEDSLLQAENAEVEARVGYRNAVTQLWQTLGTLNRRWGIKVDDIETDAQRMEPDYVRTRNKPWDRLMKGR